MKLTHISLYWGSFLIILRFTTRSYSFLSRVSQGPNGMLAEQIHNANPDQPEGRVMADSTSMFICYVLELLRWSGDKTTLDLCVVPTHHRTHALMTLCV